MFEKEVINLFGRKAILIKDNHSGTSMTLIPSAGGHLASLIFEGKELLDGFQNEAEVENNEGFKSAFLYPFPNRLKDGSYKFGNKTFQFPLNDSGQGNALHGFGAALPNEMEVIAVELSESEAIIKLSFDYLGNFDYYPWPFKFIVQFNLQKKELGLTFFVKNTSTEKMPFGLGWHPYFLLSSGENNTKLKFPEVEEIQVDERQIPTGKTETFDVFKTDAFIQQINFDTGFKLNEKSERSSVRISGDKIKSLSFSQDAQFPYFQIYIPPKRNTIAWEPMSCNIDAFNNKDGLWILSPGEERMLSCGINYD